jgi:hypothetical protein
MISSAHLIVSAIALIVSGTRFPASQLGSFRAARVEAAIRGTHLRIRPPREASMFACISPHISHVLFNQFSALGIPYSPRNGESTARLYLRRPAPVLGPTFWLFRNHIFDPYYSERKPRAPVGLRSRFSLLLKGAVGGRLARKFKCLQPVPVDTLVDFCTRRSPRCSLN